MGLFDRFRSTGNGPVDGNQSKADTSEQDALRLIDEGNAIEDEGRIEEAMQRYEAAILLAPNLARAHLNRGNILMATGDMEGALTAYSTAIKCNPDYYAAHYNLGNAHARLDHHEAALAAYHKATGLKPDFADAEVALGCTLENLGRDDEAIARYAATLTLDSTHAGAAHNLERLLLKKGARMLDTERPAELENWTRLLLTQNPDSGFAWKVLGASLQVQGKDSLSALQRATALLPEDAAVHSNLGAVLAKLNRYEDAVVSCRRATEINPDFSEAHKNLGNALHALEQLDAAETSYRRALEIRPNYVEAHNNLSGVLRDLGKFDAAAASCRRALEIKSDFPEAHGNLGNALLDLGQFDEAVASYHRALEIKPSLAIVRSSLGNALKDLGQLDDAETSYRQALELIPDDAGTHINLGIVLLEMGRFSEGWQEYEYRWEGSMPKPPRPPTQLPQWTGQELYPGDRLLVFVEQGMGDMLQFSRYLSLAVERFSGGVSILVGSPLLALFRRSFPAVEVLDVIPVDQSAWQWQCPLLSLPLAFGTTLETILKQIPYLITAPERVHHWQKRIAALGLSASTYKIGVVWKPGTNMKNAKLRSLTLQHIAPLLNQPNCAWFSLQKEPDPDSAPWVASGKLIDWSEEFGDFDETAALTVNLDLIISVDTSVAHLAGGLGMPIWLFNRHASEWRWMRDREDSPWYPTMRIFTQEKTGTWDEVVSRMSAALMAVLAANR